MPNLIIFWAVVPAVCGAVVAGVIVLVAYMYLLRSDKRKARRVETSLDVMLRNMGRMVQYVDGLPNAEPGAREPFELGRAAMDAYEWDVAIRHFREAMKEAKGTELVVLLNLIGLCHYASGRLDDALRNYEESAGLAEQFGDKEGKAANLGNIGNMYRAKGEPDKALKYHEEVLAIHREIGYQHGVATDLGNIGNIYSAKGESDKALKYLEEALAIDREIGYQPGVATDLGNIGLIYRAKGEPDRELMYCVEALAIHRGIGYQPGVASDLGNIGNIYSAKGEPEKALKYLEEALAISRGIGYQQGLANQLGNIGLIYSAKGEPDKALKHYDEALAIDREIGHKPGVASTLGNIGNAYVWAMQMRIATLPASARNGQVDGLAQKAIEYLVSALGVFLEMGIADGPRQCLWALGECYRALGREEFVTLCVKAGMAAEQAEGLAKATE